jgi:Epoxide hydrolase N terminus
VSDAITPFRIDFPEAAIDDLRERLRRTRWPEPGTAGGWPQGTPPAWVRELCRYRLEDYDFAAAVSSASSTPAPRTPVRSR